MLSHLHRIRKEFTSLLTFVFLCLVILCPLTLIALGSLSVTEIIVAVQQKWFALFTLVFAAWIAVHFWHFLDPVFIWVEYDRNNQDAPNQLHKRLNVFTRSYWGFFMGYAVVSPLLYNLSNSHTLLYKGLDHTLTMILVQMVVVYLVSMPVYLLTVDRLGKLVRFLGIDYVYNGLTTRLWQLGAVSPLMSCILIALFITHTSRTDIFLSISVIAITAVIALFGTLVCVRSIHSSLRPVQNLITRSGASTHSGLSRLKPQSTDEIGYLMQMLGKIFKRLADQESHMHAVVDNAAEGILVLNEDGYVETFNIAAEKLFGYVAQEAKGKPLSQFLPTLADRNNRPRVTDSEQEIEGIHRNGRRISMSVRVSQCRMSDKVMYTCLVADITQRKAAEGRQKRAEERYRDLVETAHDLVWSIDPQGKFTYLNSAARSIYGYGPKEMIGRNIAEFRDPDYAEQESSAFNEILKGKDLFQFETVHRDRHGNAHYISFNAKAQYDILGNVTKISGTAHDISEKKAYEKQLTFQAEHDVLTHLYNRRFFQKALDRVLARITRSAATCGLLYVDLDQFKYVNDTLGHAAGDKLLVEVSKLLKNHTREGDLLARFGGDEFTILLFDISSNNLVQVAENFRAQFENYRFLHEGHTINITCSIGATLIDSHIRNADEAMSRADLACNQAKSKGRNCIHIYNPKEENENDMAADMGWASRVRDMLDNNRLIQAFQPIVSVKTGLIHDYEVLVRMPCDDGQIILPGGFLPAAERFGLVHNIDRWMIKRCIERLSEAHEQGNRYRFSINLTGHAFEDVTLLPLIRKLLRRTGLDPSYLTFEITESTAIKEINRAIKFIQELKDIGCLFSLDDFGCGFSSFTHLKYLPVDFVKIDGSFVKGITQSSVDKALVNSINTIAHALNKQTIAECVETAEAYAVLKEIGVDYVQGHYLAYPSEELAGDDQLPSNRVQASA